MLEEMDGGPTTHESNPPALGVGPSKSGFRLPGELGR